MPSNRVSKLSLAVAAGLALSCASVSVGMGLGIGVNPAAESRRLDLRTGVVDTSIGVPLAASVGPAAKGRWFVVQLDGPMTPQRRAAIEASGIELGEYLPNYAYLAKLDQATPRSVAGLSFVRWHGEYLTSWKLDPEIGQRVYHTPERRALAMAGRDRLLVVTFPDAGINTVEAQIAAIPGAVLVESNPVGGRWELKIELGLENVGLLAELPGVHWVEPKPEALPRSNFNTRWIITSNIPAAGNPASIAFPVHSRGITGVGQVIGVIDDLVTPNHCSFFDTNPIGPTHRKIVAYNGTPGYGFHGTHVAGTAMGDPGPGVPDPSDARGVAFGARLAFGGTIGPANSEAGFINSAGFQHNAGARVHTNSWGTDGTTAYTATCRGMDRFAYDNEESLVLVAVSNASVVYTPENAKNVLGVGATGPAGSQQNFGTGGTGPTAHNLRRPEVWAPGQNTNSSTGATGCGLTTATGTSMASPAVAGAAALVRQYFVDGWYPAGAAGGPTLIPSGALMRAMIINSSQDMTGTAAAGYPGPRENWGRVHLDSVLFFAGDTRRLYVKDIRNAQGLSTGQVDETIIPVVGSAEQLRVTMVFHEPAAAVNASNITINNLDLEVVSPTGQVFRGNNFNTTTGQSITGGSFDPANTGEQVHVSNPALGAWTVRVIGTAVNQGTQGFALVATGDITGGQLPPLLISIPGGVPNLVPPGQALSLPVRIMDGSQTLVTGSAQGFFRLSPTASYTSVPLVPLGGENFRFDLPVLNCSDQPQFYVRAQASGGDFISFPATAPAAVLSTAVGVTNTTNTEVLNVDFQGTAFPAGWTGTGLWRVDSLCPPTGSPCAGTAWARYGNAGVCNYNTGSAANSGTLTSPSIALPALPFGGTITLSFCSALQVEAATSFDLADVLVNGQQVASVPRTPGWTTQTVNLTQFQGQTVTVGFRFNTVDGIQNDFPGWRLDDIRINAVVTTTTCTQPCYANCDASTGTPLLTPADFVCFLNKFRAGDPYANCDASTGTPTLTPADFVCFLNKFRAGC